MVGHITMVELELNHCDVTIALKLHVSPDMLPFSLCNKERLAIQHMDRPLFLKTLSALSYIRK
jgi:hypothetical protein